MKKRMFTMIFAIIMVIAVSIPCVSAATSELVTTKKVSFTAECSKPGYEFSVYKIADLKTTTNPYSVKYDVKVSSGEVQVMVADGNLSDANRAKILNALDKDTQLAGASIVGTYKVDTDGNSKTFTNLAQGIYYVRATNFPSGVKKATNSAFALPYYTAENGWVYDLDTINLAAKVEEDNPDIEKEITNSTQNNVNFTDVSIGDTVEFKIESSVVGAVNNVDVLDFKLNSYVVTDVMSKGLTLNQKSFAVSLEDENDKNLAEIAASDYTVKLTYTNKNDVKGEVDGNKVFVYTYHIQVHKLDEKGKALSGAEFELYKTEADAKAEKNAIATGTSDKDGLVVFNNANKEEMLLQSGKYFVKETKAPTGYNRYTDVIPAEINVTYGDALTNGTYIVKGPDLGLVSFDVKNSKTVLPQTGGQGNVIIYSVAVSLAVAGGVILLVLRRKKKSADKSA